jgi:predicted metal-dependent hydrolase
MDNRLLRGCELFNREQFFEAHEELEGLWMECRGGKRLFLQGLIHIAVGFHHWGKGNREGAVRQLRKGLKKLAGYLPASEGINTARFYRECAAALERLEAGEDLAGRPRIRIQSE